MTAVVPVRQFFTRRFNDALTLPSRDVLSSALLQCQRPTRISVRSVRCECSSQGEPADKPAVLRSLDLLDTLLPPEPASAVANKADSPGDGWSKEAEEDGPSVSWEPSGAARLSAAESTGLTSVRGFGELKALAEKKLRKVLNPPTLTELGAKPDALPTVQPKLSYYILLLNILIYAAGLTARWFDGSGVAEDYFLSLAKVNSEIEAGQYYRLLTANFLHDSFIHLAASCYALWTLAPEVEKVLGYRIFAAVYILTGLAGSTACFMYTDTITVGASSGLFGLIGALMAYLWKNQHIQQSSEQLMSIAGIIIVNLVLGSWEETSIDNLGHIVGLIIGAYLGWGLAPQLAPVEAPSEDEAGPAQQSGGGEAGILGSSSVSGEPVPRVEDLGNPLRRWAGCISFAVCLGLIVAGTIVQRTGQLPPPTWWIPGPF